ncbi:MAG: endoribonuclease YicC domain-containing protein, partial [Planctomycetota bacterium]
KAAVRRGSATVQVVWEPQRAVAWDEAALAATWRSLAAQAAELGAPVPALEQVARLVPQCGGVDVSSLAEPVGEAVAAALDELDAMRAREGGHLAASCKQQVDGLAQLCTAMRTAAAERLQRYRQLLLERVQEAVAERAEITSGELVREVVLHADRIDVDEELVRLASHLDQLRACLDGQEDVGKRLEFLLQEVGREINTTGAKANDAELTRLVCEAKRLVEQLREQAANIL